MEPDKTDQPINDWLQTFLSLAADDMVSRIVAGARGQIPVENWEAEAIRQGIAAKTVGFENGSFQLPKRLPWSLFAFNREYLTHVATYIELIQKYGPTNVRAEQAGMDLVVSVPPELIAVEVKKSEAEGKTLATNLLKILPKPDLVVRDRGDDPIRKAKALLELKAHQFWIVTPTKRWHFKVEYPRDEELLLSPI